MLCALLAGCGGAGGHVNSGHVATKSAATTSTTLKPLAGVPIPAKDVPIVARDTAACEGAVKSLPGLSTSAKSELAGLCFRINYVPEDNERTVRAACEEAANASSLASDSARKRAAAECYSHGFVD